MSILGGELGLFFAAITATIVLGILAAIVIVVYARRQPAARPVAGGGSERVATRNSVTQASQPDNSVQHSTSMTWGSTTAGSTRSIRRVTTDQTAENTRLKDVIEKQKLEIKRLNHQNEQLLDRIKMLEDAYNFYQEQETQKADESQKRKIISPLRHELKIDEIIETIKDKFDSVLSEQLTRSTCEEYYRVLQGKGKLLDVDEVRKKNAAFRNAIDGKSIRGFDVLQVKLGQEFSLFILPSIDYLSKRPEFLESVSMLDSVLGGIYDVETSQELQYSLKRLAIIANANDAAAEMTKGKIEIR